MISCTGLFALFKMIITVLQTDEDLFALFSELREASRRGSAREEARRPFNVPGFPISRFLTLTFLKLLFLSGSLVVLLGENSFSNTVPELARLIRQLLLSRGNDLLDRPQRVDINQESFVGILGGGTRTSGEVDLVMPGTLDAANDGLVRDVLDSCDVVVVNVTFVDHTLNLVLGLA